MFFFSFTYQICTFIWYYSSKPEKGKNKNIILVMRSFVQTTAVQTWELACRATSRQLLVRCHRPSILSPHNLNHSLNKPQLKEAILVDVDALETLQRTMLNKSLLYLPSAKLSLTPSLASNSSLRSLVSKMWALQSLAPQRSHSRMNRR